MEKLDNFDLKLLSELENNSRQTLSQIAKKLNTSQQVISYRIQSLQKNNIIGGFYTLINFASLNYTSYRTMVRLTNIDEIRHKEIISYLNEHTNVLWIVECGGRWDLIVNFMAKNIIQYNNFLKEFKNKFPEQIQNYDTLTTIEGIYFGRDYFVKKLREIKQLLYFGRELKSIKVDKIDLKILDLISENANTPYSAYKALIKFQNITDERENEIINYLKNNINIIGILKFIGLWDFEIEMEVDSKEQMLKITRDFRDKFKDVIKEFEIIPLFHEYKYNYFPRDLLKVNSQ